VPLCRRWPTCRFVGAGRRAALSALADVPLCRRWPLYGIRFEPPHG
jgi:hypothetical protein